MINRALRSHIEARREALEDTLRRFLKEELAGYGTKKNTKR